MGPNGNLTRRALLGSATAAALLAALPKAGAGTKEWKPRLGILGKYTEDNVDFALHEGFNNMILNAGAGTRDWIRRSSPTSKSQG